MYFTHLHVHSHYSILDGMSAIPDLVDKAMRSGMYSLALTDHGNMFGIKELFDYSSKINGKVKGKIKEKETEIQQISASENPDLTKIEALQHQLKELKSSFFKPIFGCEVYVARRNHLSKDAKEDRSGWHLVLLAKNETGYHNLCKLVSYSWIDGFHYRPRIDHALLEKYKEGLIVCSACLGGEIHKKVESGNLEEAEKAILWHKELFGEDYYIELQRHKTNKPGADTEVYEKQVVQNKQLVDLARKTNTKLIATNDVHFVEEEHAEAHDRLICLSTGKDLDDANRMRYTKQEWLKTPEEMAAIFSDLPEALENTKEIVEKIEFFNLDGDPIMPAYDIPETFGTEAGYRQQYTEEDLLNEFSRSEKGEVVMSREEAEQKIKKIGGYDKLYRIKLEADYLKELAMAGAKKRYGEDIDPEIMERLEFELHIMKTMGFPGYFLIVQDFIQAARNMGVSVGPGRGSAAGSVVAYCLRITDIDPLKYDLLFERFLNPDRISLPDIDIDFDDDGRGEVLRWVTEKYGKEKVAHIITYGTMATKSSIKDVARVQKLPLTEAERLTKMVPDKFPEDPKTGKAPKVNLNNCFEYVSELRDARYSTNDDLASVLKYASMLEGTVRQTGVHACGVIIGAEDLTNFVPLSTAKDKDTGEEILVTQFEGSVIENIGLIKMDFLGLKTLSIIKEAVANIKKSKNVDVDIDAIPIDDPATYQLYSKGLTVGTFQFESPGMQKYLRELKPTKFEDIIAMNALYRPGPMQYIPQFINRKHGLEKIKYPFPEMEKRLKETYGITVYQEQVMLLSRDLAGFTRGQSDELRKAMGKKMIDKMEALKVKFLEGAEKKGFGPRETLEQIWKDWAEFAKYAFNKSHATCYSWVSYQTAYLKAHYPAEFMAANLTRNKDDIGEVTKFMDECRNLGINVLGPDVNESDLHFTVNSKGDIRFGLGGIKGVGESAVEAIIKERKKNGAFKSIFDFIERVNLTSCNKKNIESLALAGGFDNFSDVTREQFFTCNSKGELVLESLVRYGNRFQADSQSAQNSLFGGIIDVEIAKPEIPQADTWSDLERLNKEKELVGIYLSAHPLDQFEMELKYGCNVTVSELKDLDEQAKKNTELILGGMIVSVKKDLITKKGNSYGKFTLEDYSGTYEFALFGNDYVNFNKFLQKDLFVYIRAKIQQRGADWKYKSKDADLNMPPVLELKIKSMELLPEIKDNIFEKMTISMPLMDIDDDIVETLDSFFVEKRGNVRLYFQVMDDMETSSVLTLFSRNVNICITKKMISFLEEVKKEKNISFRIN